MILNINKKTKMLILKIISIFVIYTLISCGNICGDIFDRSPEQLVSENEYIIVGKFQSVDTIADLGSVKYLGSTSRFLILEYSFAIDMNLKNANNISNIYFWNCERVDLKSGYTTIINFNKNEKQLVYGNEIQRPQDFINTMTPFSDVGELRNMINNKNVSYNWNTQFPDSIIADRILESNSMKNIFHFKLKTGKILYGTDIYLTTLIDYKSGNLCFYNNAGQGKRVSSKEYLHMLQKKLNK